MYEASDITGPAGDCCKGPKGPDAFETFQYTAEDLIDRLGLTDWSVEFAQEKLNEGVKIQTSINYGARVAHLALSTTVDGCDTAKCCAKLAVCNILFADLDYAIAKTNISNVERNTLQNAIIRRLENVL